MYIDCKNRFYSLKHYVNTNINFNKIIIDYVFYFINNQLNIKRLKHLAFI